MSRGKTYSDEFKADAVKLSKKWGIKKAADSLGIAPSTLHGWCNKALLLPSSTKLNSKSEPSYEELLKKFKQQEKELRYMHEINKVLKKSLGIMGQDSLDHLKK